MTTLISLESTVRIRIGDRRPGAYRWQPEEIQDLLVLGMNKYNSEEPAQHYEITGSGDGRAFNPVPTDNDLELLLLYTELIAVESDRKSSTDFAVKRTSPLGSFDGTEVTKQRSFEISRIKNEIKQHKKVRGRDAARTGMEARGISKSEPDRITTE